MNMWKQAHDSLNEVNDRGMTVDQQLKVAEVQALLAIAQELKSIRHEGINPLYDPQFD